MSFLLWLYFSTCHRIVSIYPEEYREDRRAACVEVLVKAQRRGLEPSIVLRLVRLESGFDETAIGAAGEEGLGQAIRDYWCLDSEGPNCDMTEASMRALDLLSGCARINWTTLTCDKKRKGPRDWKNALCKYNTGKPCHVSGTRYANKILTRTLRKFN